MRFLLYLNMLAIVWLAGSLAQFYQGAPLPWGEVEKPAATAPSLPVPSIEAVKSSPATPPVPTLTVEQLMALGLPLPNPERVVAAPEAVNPEPLRLVMLTEGDYPPFNFYENGELSGFDVDLAAALCERLAAECRFERRQWTDLVPALKRGEGDAVMASMLIPVAGRESPAANGEVIFTDSYYSTPGRFAARRGDAPPAATASGLAGRRIGVQAGSVHQAFALARFSTAELVPFKRTEEAEEALARGKIDLIFADRNALLRWVADKGSACCGFVGPDYADPAYFGEGAGIVLRAEDVELRGRMNAALSALVADGTYARISARYFSTSIY
jgi:polar amino acid transport system substrate-binding protein